MPEERSVVAYEHYREAAQRFEYFIVGVAGALCAYVSQHLAAKKLGLNSYTVEVVSLLVLSGAVVAGLLRIHTIVKIHANTTKKLCESELLRQLVEKPKGQPIVNTQTGDVYTQEDADKQIVLLRQILEIQEKKYKLLNSFASRCFSIRNWLLLLGFLGLVLSKILEPYFSP